MTSLIAVLALLVGTVGPSQVQERVVLGTNVSCRQEPSRSAEKLGVLEVGDLIMDVSDSRRSTSDDWVLVQAVTLNESCWVYAGLTASQDRRRPAEALLAIADHMLSSKAWRDLADYVKVDNFFRQGYVVSSVYAVDVADSPLLSLRRLELLSLALSSSAPRRLRRDPFQHAWILSFGSIVRYFEPGGRWIVTREAYLDLYERFAATRWSEELAWAAARQPRYDDCEGSTDCLLGRILESGAIYWALYPRGRFISEALARALAQVQSAAQCGEITLREPASLRRLDEVRRSIAEIQAVEKEELIALLLEIERGCSS